MKPGLTAAQAGRIQKRAKRHVVHIHQSEVKSAFQGYFDRKGISMSNEMGFEEKAQREQRKGTAC